MTEDELIEVGDDIDEEPDFTIQNIVATSTLAIENEKKIDLNEIMKKESGAEYNPERFPGLILRVKNPKATVLVFTTGKLVITGMKKAEEKDVVVKKVLKIIKKTGIKKINPTTIVQNVVASGDLKNQIDLNMAAIVMENSMYEPEVFPGLIYRIKEPKAVILIFSTGKVVITGCKTKETVREIMIRVKKDVVELGVIASPMEDNEGYGITYF